VLVPGGVIAEWCYPLLDVPEAPDVAQVIVDMDARMRSWWPPERAHVDAHYRDLPFPFDTLASDAFTADAMAMTASWTLDQMIGYVSTWSAVSRYRKANDEDPVIAFAERLRAAWGSASTHVIRWPLVMRVGHT
jgi:hypothetical protein